MHKLSKRFVNKLKSNNLEASKKRAVFLKESKEKLKVKNINNVIIITTEEGNSENS